MPHDSCRLIQKHDVDRYATASLVVHGKMDMDTQWLRVGVRASVWGHGNAKWFSIRVWRDAHR